MSSSGTQTHIWLLLLTRSHTVSAPEAHGTLPGSKTQLRRFPASWKKRLRHLALFGAPAQHTRSFGTQLFARSALILDIASICMRLPAELSHARRQWDRILGQVYGDYLRRMLGATSHMCLSFREGHPTTMPQCRVCNRPNCHTSLHAPAASANSAPASLMSSCSFAVGSGVQPGSLTCGLSLLGLHHDATPMLALRRWSLERHGSCKGTSSDVAAVRTAKNLRAIEARMQQHLTNPVSNPALRRTLGLAHLTGLHHRDHRHQHGGRGQRPECGAVNMATTRSAVSRHGLKGRSLAGSAYGVDGIAEHE